MALLLVKRKKIAAERVRQATRDDDGVFTEGGMFGMDCVVDLPKGVTNLSTTRVARALVHQSIL